MSTQAPVRRPAGGGGFGPRGGMMGSTMPAEKSMDFWPSAKRLVRRLRPERVGVVTVMLMTVVGVTLSVVGPKILGNATNLIFEGVIGQQLPAGITQDQAIAALRADGQDQLADLLTGMTVVPGQGVDFEALARVLILVLVLYVASSLIMWLQAFILNGLVQRTA